MKATVTKKEQKKDRKNIVITINPWVCSKKYYPYWRDAFFANNN